jgi:hypothetical protein
MLIVPKTSRTWQFEEDKTTEKPSRYHEILVLNVFNMIEEQNLTMRTVFATFFLPLLLHRLFPYHKFNSL